MSTKKAFDFTCSSIFVADPMQLCIIGGAALPDGQRGPIDTAEDRAHVLYDPRLLLPIESAHLGANEVRTDDSIPAKVEKIKRGKERGISDDDLAIAFGCTPAYVRQLLAFDDRAVEEVRAAVADGSLAPTAAMHLVRNAKTDDAQRAAVAKLAASGEKPSTQRAVRAAKEESGEPVARRPSRQEIRERMVRAREDGENAVADVLQWVLGS